MKKLEMLQKKNLLSENWQVQLDEQFMLFIADDGDATLLAIACNATVGSTSTGRFVAAACGQALNAHSCEFIYSES